MSNLKQYYLKNKLKFWFIFIFCIFLYSVLLFFCWVIIAGFSLCVAYGLKEKAYMLTFAYYKNNYFLNYKIALIALAISLIIFISIYLKIYFNLKKNAKNKNIYCSSDWLTKKEFNNHSKKSYLNHPHSYGWVIKTKLKHKKIINYTCAKQHALVMGSTGSGKTQNIILPTILNNIYSNEKPNMIISDPKGSLYKDLHKIAKKQNYDVLVLDFVNFKGISWNPLLKIQKLWLNKKYSDAEDYADIVIESLVSKIENNRDPIWHLSARSLIIAIVIRIVIDKQLNKFKPDLTFGQILNWLVSPVDELQEWIKEQINQNHYLRNNAGIIIENKEPKFLETIKRNAQMSLQPFKNMKFAKMSLKNDIDYQSFISKATILFINTHLTDSTYWFCNQIFLNLFLKDLMHSDNLNKKRPLLFILDEFGNIPPIKNFINVLSTAREYNIWFMLAIQWYDQLNKYSNYTGIIANCGLKYYLHSNDVKTAKMVSEEYGFKTRVIYNSAKNTNKQPQKIRQPLIDYYQLTKLSNNQIIVKMQGLNPYKVQFIPFYILNKIYD